MSAGARTLVLLRHGRTEWNATGRVQGQAETDLDATGRAQATAVARLLAELSPARLAASDLGRARATAEYVAAATGLVPVFDRRLREYDLGEREGVSHAEYAAAHPEEHARFETGDFDVVPGGETAAGVRERIVPALRELLDGTPDGGVAVAVSHGAAIKVATAALLGWPDDAHRTLHAVDNCAWVQLESGPGGVRLRAYNRGAASGS